MFLFGYHRQILENILEEIKMKNLILIIIFTFISLFSFSQNDFIRIPDETRTIEANKNYVLNLDSTRQCYIFIGEDCKLDKFYVVPLKSYTMDTLVFKKYTRIFTYIQGTLNKEGVEITICNKNKNIEHISSQSNNKHNGVSYHFSSNVLLGYIYFKNGEYNGPDITYNQEGGYSSRTYWNKNNSFGYRDSSFYYYPNGNLKVREKYFETFYTYELFYENGNLKSYEKFNSENYPLDTIFSYYENGKIYKEIDFTVLDYKKREKTYNIDGLLIEDYYWKEEQKTGYKYKYDKDNKLSKTIEFKNGTKIK